MANPSTETATYPTTVMSIPLLVDDVPSVTGDQGLVMWPNRIRNELIATQTEVDSHKSASDPHTNYILADGTRAFTGVVAGITPTLAAHLATKNYVDTTLSTIDHIVDNDGDTKVQVEESADDDTVRIDAAGSEVATFTNALATVKTDLKVIEANTAGDTNFVIENSEPGDSTITASLKYQFSGGYAGGKIVSDAIGDYTTASERDSSLKFYTSTDGVDTLAMIIDDNQDVTIGDGSNLGQRLLVEGSAATTNFHWSSNAICTIGNSDIGTGGQLGACFGIIGVGGGNGGLYIQAVDDVVDGHIYLNPKGGNVAINKSTAAATALDVSGAITASTTITGATITDGTASISSGAISGATTIASSTGITGGYGRFNKAAISSSFVTESSAAMFAGTGSASVPIGISAGAYSTVGGYIQSTFDSGAAPLIINPDGGNVGINNTDPQAKLEIYSDSSDQLFLRRAHATTGAPYLTFYKSRGTESAPTAAQDDDQLGWLVFKGYGATGWVQGAIIKAEAEENFTDAAAGSRLVFGTTATSATSYTERMRITEDGKVGIGTTAPGSGLQVDGTFKTRSAYNVTEYFNSNIYGGAVALRKSKSSTLGTQAAVVFDDILGDLRFEGSDGSAFVIGAKIRAQTQGAWASTDCPTKLVFSTCPDGSGTALDRVVIDYNGTLTINEPSANATPLSASGDGTYQQILVNTGAYASQPECRLDLRGEWSTGSHASLAYIACKKANTTEYDADGELRFSTRNQSTGFATQQIIDEDGYVYMPNLQSVDNDYNISYNNSTGELTKTAKEYGEIYTNGNGTATTISVQNTWYQVVTFSANGQALGATADHTNDHITIATTGKYLITVSAAFSGGGGKTYEMQVKKNNGGTSFANIYCTRKLGASGDVGSCSLSGIASLTAADTIELWIRCTDSSTSNATLTDVTLSIVKI